MHKIIMCASLAFNFYDISIKDDIHVNYIEYNGDYNNAFVNLNISLYSSFNDIVELKVYFFDKDGIDKKDNFYLSSLRVQGNKKTFARIPFVLKEDIVLNLVFYSDNLKSEFENIMFPIYVKNSTECNLSYDFVCKSDRPSTIIYENNNLVEIYDELVLINDNLQYKTVNNTIPLNRIKIGTKSLNKDGFANLYIIDKINEVKLDYTDKYTIPLNIEVKNNVVSFSVSNKYYLDLLNGITYENYHYDTIHTNQVVFPYRNERYKMIIELINCYYFFEKVVVNFEVITEGNLLGNCVSSKYCLRRIY